MNVLKLKCTSGTDVNVSAAVVDLDLEYSRIDVVGAKSLVHTCPNFGQVVRCKGDHRRTGSAHCDSEQARMLKCLVVHSKHLGQTGSVFRAARLVQPVA